MDVKGRESGRKGNKDEKKREKGWKKNDGNMLGKEETGK